MLRVLRAVLISAAVLGGPGFTHSAAAQGVAADRGPRFLLASANRLIPLDVERTPVLALRLALDLEGATLKEALATISQQAGLRLVYSDEDVPLDRRVHLRAEAITVAAALTDVLLGAEVDVVFSPNGGASLVKRSGPVMAQPGSIVGRVIDASSGRGLELADVILGGTRWRTVTAADGHYRLSNVEPGNYSLIVRRIGYTRLTRAVTVISGADTTVDVALIPAPSTLEEIVVTATGDQRLLELGHVVGRIKADSLVKEAPITTITELLTARVPGLQVFQQQGVVGGDVRIQIRGVNSLALNTEPIVIVDGVRYATPRLGSGLIFQASESTNRLNDLNPNDIESIEVVKGPSAATLYGTDASNGVLVITTKHGRQGPARWSTYGRVTRMTSTESRFPDQYWAWNQQFGVSGSCALQFVAAGYCTQDSVTRIPNPLNVSSTSILGARTNYQYGANVAGGLNDLRYYFSADVDEETGPLRFPPALRQQLEQRLGTASLPEGRLDPNNVGKLNLRANVLALLGDRGSLRVNAGYTQSDTRLFEIGDGISGAWTVSNPTVPYSGLFHGTLDLFHGTSTEKLNHYELGASGSFRPVAWLDLYGRAGIDVANTVRNSFRPRVDSVIEGAIEEDRNRTVTSTFDLRATGAARRGTMSFRTTLGAQYVRSQLDGTSNYGSGLPPGGGSLQQAASLTSLQSFNELVTLGGYLEEVLGHKERLFVSGALRLDGASTFGRDYDAALYPKLGVSWLASEERFFRRVPLVDELRLRYAYGASGQQPLPEMSRGALSEQRTYDENGNPIIVLGTPILGNPDLKPERVREHEWGFDAGLFSNRIRLELAWYRRKTMDALRLINLPSGLSSQWVNIGLIRDKGFEVQLNAQIVRGDNLSFDIALSHSSDDSRLEDIGAGLPQYNPGGGFVEGYPLGARFTVPLLGFNDVNGDGIIVPDEIQLGSTPVYAGRSTPPHTETLSGTLGLLNRRLRISALFERRSGFTSVDRAADNGCATLNCPAAVRPGTSLRKQADAVARTMFTQYGSYTPVHEGDFIRLRELSLSVDLPARLLRALRLREGTLSITGRNLALWTAFANDPESTGGVSPTGPSFGGPPPGIYGGVVGGLPQSRSWTARVDLGL